MIHLPKRHFFNLRNQKQWSKEKKQMGGPEYRILQPHEIAAFTRGQEPTRDPVQETIDSLNAAIDRLDKTINEMKEQLNGPRD
jgi:hypothetical protein